MNNSPFNSPTEPLRPTGDASTSNKVALGCLIPFLSVFFFAGLGILYFVTIVPVFHWKQAQTWVATPCKIVSSQIVTHSDSDGSTYSADIAYSYSFQGQTFTDNTYSHARPGSGSYSGAQARASQFPVGATITCYVNPLVPSEAVLNNDFELSLLSGLFGLIFMLFPIVILVSLLRSSRSRAKPHANWTPNNATVLAASASGGLVLRAQNGSLWTRMAVAWGVTLFWNGIVGFFVYQALHERNGVSLFMGLFLIPFVLVGLLILSYAISSIGALFNPRPVLSFSSAEVRPGELIEVSYELRGGFTRPQSLNVYLEGREEATFVQGTTTSTSKASFYYQALMETSTQMASGSFQIQVPTGTMHSFEAPNNKIVWLVTLNAPIKGWTDIKEQWKLNVLPSR